MKRTEDETKGAEDENEGRRTGCRILLFIGSLIVIYGAVLLVKAAGFVSRASKVSGVVVEMERSGSAGSGLTYYTPIFTFADASGIIHTQHLATSVSSSSTVKLGDKVPILYDPSTPDHWKMDAFKEVWSSPLTLIGFGLVVGGLPWLAVFRPGWMLTAIVLLLLFAVGSMLWNPVRLLITGERAQGVVVEMAKSGSLQSPTVEFVTSTGERVRVCSRLYSASPSTRVGDAVTVAFDPSQPRDAQLFLWRELSMVGAILGFIGFVLFIWIGVILIGGPVFNDPFHLLPAVISRFRLDPVRTPLYGILALLVLLCGGTTYVLSKEALDLRANGIKAVGHVIGSQTESSRLSDGSSAIGAHCMIEYQDASGTAHRIRRSLVKRLSRLKTGDVVEVLYRAGQPDKAIVNTWDELYPAPLFFGSVTLAFLVLLRLVLSGSIDIGSARSKSGSLKKLKASGVPVVATVIEANLKKQFLRYQIHKHTRAPAADDADDEESYLADVSLAWNPSKADARIKQGDQFRAYVDPLNSSEIYVDFGHRIDDPLVTSRIKKQKALAAKLTSLATTGSRYLTQESLSEILELIEGEELPLAFETLVTRIMSLPRSLPDPLQRVDWEDYLEVGAGLGLDKEAEEDPEFWTKFRAFVNALKSRS